MDIDLNVPSMNFSLDLNHTDDLSMEMPTDNLLLEGSIPPRNTPAFIGCMSTSPNSSRAFLMDDHDFDFMKAAENNNLSLHSKRQLIDPIAPLNIPGTAMNDIDHDLDVFMDEQRSILSINSSISGSTISAQSALSTGQLMKIPSELEYNPIDFTRSAPSHGGFNTQMENHSLKSGWDHLLTWNSPNDFDSIKKDEALLAPHLVNLDSGKLKKNKKKSTKPSFMRSHFFVDNGGNSLFEKESLWNRRTSGDRIMPQSAPGAITSLQLSQQPNELADVGFVLPWNKQPFYVASNSASDTRKQCRHDPLSSSTSQNNAFSVHESDIFGSNKNVKRRRTGTNSHRTNPRSENEPIINLIDDIDDIVGSRSGNKNEKNKRNKNRKRSFSNVVISPIPGPPSRKMRRNTNDHHGLPIHINYNSNVNNFNINVPPAVSVNNQHYQMPFCNYNSGSTNNSMIIPHLPGQVPPHQHHQQQPITPTVINAMNNIQINTSNTQNNTNLSGKRKRGRPRKNPLEIKPMQKRRGMRVRPHKYDGMKKAERERLRRKELKNGYQHLTDMLALKPGRSGSSLPERSSIVAAACNEIRRLEKQLFEMTMARDSKSIAHSMKRLSGNRNYPPPIKHSKDV